MSGTSNRTSCWSTTSGATRALRPSTNSTLKMLLPTILPSAMSGAPVRLACRLTASSGELVPKATTVSPITSGEIPIAAANRDAPRTRASAPTMRSTIPATKNNSIPAFMTCPVSLGRLSPV